MSESLSFIGGMRLKLEDFARKIDTQMEMSRLVVAAVKEELGWLAW